MKFNKALVGVLFLTIFFAGAVAVEAGRFGRHHRPPGIMGHGFHGLKTMIQLDLSDSQQSKILSITEKYENERESLGRALERQEETSPEFWRPNTLMKMQSEMLFAGRHQSEKNSW
jgi:Spy/CpxP family protein refolding chaperone